MADILSEETQPKNPAPHAEQPFFRHTQREILAHQRRFGLAYLVLAVGIGVAVGLGIVLIGRGSSHHATTGVKGVHTTKSGELGAKQIANAVAGFYGADAGTGMLKLLAGHWAGVKALTDATHAGDKAAADKAMQELATNAGEIAKFLHGANPANWPEATVDGLLLEHVADHHAQLGEIMSGDTAAEAKTWAAMQEHMNMIADALAGGIAKQFPAKAQ